MNVTVTRIQLHNTGHFVFHLCTRHLLDLALHINQQGFSVLPSGQQNLLAGSCDSCNNCGPRVLQQ